MEMNRTTVNLLNFRRIRFPRSLLVIACLALTGIVGYADYITGYERSLLLFYLLPISLAAWFGGFVFSLVMAVVCILIWVLSDLGSGIPAVRFWNIGMAFCGYVLFAGVLSKLAMLVRELDRRVDERTAALEGELAGERRLDQPIPRVAGRERHPHGLELQQRPGQHLY